MKVVVDVILCQKLDNTYYYPLVKRNFDPYKGKWALPGGHVEDEDTILESVVKEVKEELGLEIEEDWVHIAGYVDDPKRDPRGRYISFVSYVTLPLLKESELPPLEGDIEVQEVKWFTSKQIKELDLAFDHNKILMDFA